MSSIIGENTSHLFQEVLRTYFESDRVDEQAKNAYSQLKGTWSSSSTPSAPHEWSQIADNVLCIGSHVLKEGSTEKHLVSTLHSVMRLFSLFIESKIPLTDPKGPPAYFKYGSIAASSIAATWAAYKYENTALPKVLAAYWKVRPLLSTWAQRTQNTHLLNYLDQNAPRVSTVQDLATIIAEHPLPSVSIGTSQIDLKEALHLALDLIFKSDQEEEKEMRLLIDRAIEKKLVAPAEKQLLQEGIKGSKNTVIPLIAKAVVLSLVTHDEALIPSYMKEEELLIRKMRSKLDSLESSERALFTLCTQVSELPPGLEETLSPSVRELKAEVNDLILLLEKDNIHFTSQVHLMFLREKTSSLNEATSKIKV